MMIAPRTIIQLEISYPAIDVFRLNHSIALLPRWVAFGDNNSKSGQDRPIGSRQSCLQGPGLERTRLCHGVVDMANGQVVLVTTEGLSGGSPMRTVYYVAEEDPTKAQAIIAEIMAPNEKVEAYGLLPEAAVKALGLKPGEFRSV